jgi:hypothetical protein
MTVPTVGYNQLVKAAKNNVKRFNSPPNFLLKVDGQARTFLELVTMLELNEEGTKRLRVKIANLRAARKAITMAQLITVKGN